MVVGLTTANENLTVYGNTTIGGSCTAGGKSAQRAIASGSASAGEAALFVAPGTMKSLLAGAGVSLTTDGSTNVVTVKANLANYGSGADVEYLLDAGNQAVKSLLLGNSVALADSGGGSVYVHHKPYVAFRYATIGGVSTAVSPGQIASAGIT